MPENSKILTKRISDQVNAEVLKACTYSSASALQPLFVQTWREENIPDDWLEAVLVIISKKADLSEISRHYAAINCPQSSNQSFTEPQLDATIRRQQAGLA